MRRPKVRNLSGLKYIVEHRKKKKPEGPSNEYDRQALYFYKYRRIRTSDIPDVSRGAPNQLGENKKATPFEVALWAQKDSNLRHPACKAGALNQLSYAPAVF